MDENKVVEIKEEEAAQAAGGKNPAFPKNNPPQYYTLQWGDTLSEIACWMGRGYGYINTLCQINGIQNPDKIKAGQTIRLW